MIQLAGAAAAAWFLQALVNVSASFGSNYPAASYSSSDAFLMETVLTLGLVSVILGTASGAQNLGVFGALGGWAATSRWPGCGQPDLGRLDESRPDVRARPGRRRLHRVLGLYRRAAPRSHHRRGFAFILARPGRWSGRLAAAQGALFTAAENPGPEITEPPAASSTGERTRRCTPSRRPGLRWLAARSARPHGVFRGHRPGSVVPRSSSRPDRTRDHWAVGTRRVRSIATSWAGRFPGTRCRRTPWTGWSPTGTSASWSAISGPPTDEAVTQ